jgi:beta-glucosidase-like glycosyl hydrolase
MPEESQVARHIITGLPADGVDGRFESQVGRTPFSGYLLFRHDFKTLDELAKLSAELKRLSPPPPPLIYMDEEGGLVTQLSPDYEVSPSARVLGRGANTEEVRSLAWGMGDTLRSGGVDVDFAPVYDVDREPANPVIGPRAFSRDPEVVAELANAFAAGLSSGGALACAKHFPGHGETKHDSHLSLPVCPASREELDAVHLLPFRGAISAGLPLVMVSHVAYPALDPDELPATLSPTVITDLLRGEMGFDGVVVTDAMEMKAVADRFSAGEAAVRAIEAGADLLCYGCYDDGVEEAIAALGQAVRSGRLSEARLARSRSRIEILEERARTCRESATRETPPEPGALEPICRRALRWVGPEQQPDRLVARNSRWLVVEPEWPDRPSVARLLEGRGRHVEVRSTWETLAETEPGEADAVLVASRHRTAPSPGESLWLAGAIAERPTWIVAFAQDAFLQELSGATGRLSSGDPGPAMRRAVVDALFGQL